MVGANDNISSSPLTVDQHTDLTTHLKGQLAKDLAEFGRDDIGRRYFATIEIFEAADLARF
jgi:hypothetical protein